MEKNRFLIASLLLASLSLTACSSADDNVVIIDEKTGEEITVSKDYIEEKENETKEYSEHLSKVFNESLSLQDTFAHDLDAMFTK